MDILGKIPAILDSTKGAELSPFRYKIDKATQGIMQYNYSTIAILSIVE